MSIFCLGSVNTDLVIRCPHLPRPGETVLGGEFYQAQGGKGANQAVAAARAIGQPGRVTFLGAVGSDEYGKVSRRALLEEGIECTHLKEVNSVPSGIAFILVDERGENLIGVASGANGQLLPADIDALAPNVFASAKVFLASLEVPLQTVERGLTRAKEQGLYTILNPAPITDAAAVRTLLPLVDLLTPNEHELAALTQQPVDSEESATAAARRLNLRVIVTLGDAGAVIVDRDAAAEHIPPFPVTPVDTTAAGDCFSGALASALAEGDELLAATRFASAAAALSVTRSGAQPSLPRREEIEALLRRG